MSERLTPFLEAPATSLLALFGVTIVLLHLLARRRSMPWAPTVIRVLAVLSLVMPALQIVSWAQGLSEARELAGNLSGRPPGDGGPVLDGLIANATALLSLGFIVMISGIYLARRLPGAPPTGQENRP